MNSRSTTRINIVEGAYIFWRYQTAWLDARPLVLRRRSLQLHEQDQALRKAVEIISKSKEASASPKTEAPKIRVPRAEAIIEHVPDPGSGKITLEMPFTLHAADYKRRNRVSSHLRATFPFQAFLRAIAKDKPAIYGRGLRVKLPRSIHFIMSLLSCAWPPAP